MRVKMRDKMRVKMRDKLRVKMRDKMRENKIRNKIQPKKFMSVRFIMKKSNIISALGFSLVFAIAFALVFALVFGLGPSFNSSYAYAKAPKSKSKRVKKSTGSFFDRLNYHQKHNYLRKKAAKKTFRKPAAATDVIKIGRHKVNIIHLPWLGVKVSENCKKRTPRHIQARKRKNRLGNFIQSPSQGEFRYKCQALTKLKRATLKGIPHPFKGGRQPGRQICKKLNGKFRIANSLITGKQRFFCRFKDRSYIESYGLDRFAVRNDRHGKKFDPLLKYIK